MLKDADEEEPKDGAVAPDCCGTADASLKKEDGANTAAAPCTRAGKRNAPAAAPAPPFRFARDRKAPELHSSWYRDGGPEVWRCVVGTTVWPRRYLDAYERTIGASLERGTVLKVFADPTKGLPKYLIKWRRQDGSEFTSLDARHELRRASWQPHLAASWQKQDEASADASFTERLAAAAGEATRAVVVAEGEATRAAIQETFAPASALLSAGGEDQDEESSERGASGADSEYVISLAEFRNDLSRTGPGGAAAARVLAEAPEDAVAPTAAAGPVGAAGPATVSQPAVVAPDVGVAEKDAVAPAGAAVAPVEEDAVDDAVEEAVEEDAVEDVVTEEPEDSKRSAHGSFRRAMYHSLLC